MNDAALAVSIEVSGCETTCAHCWALGGAYGTMPLGDAEFALAALETYCRERGRAYTAYPMHEVTAHPDAPALLRLFTPHLGGAYDPILTPGTPLATRPDWEDVLDAAKECGAHALWVAFHGFEEAHDRTLARPGGFAETCLAVRRAAAHGLGTGANVFLTTPMLAGIHRLLDALAGLPLGGLWIGPAVFTATPRGRRYERLRPRLDELVAVADRAAPLSTATGGCWRELASLTEAAWVERALDGEWPDEPWREARHQLVVRRNLDVFTGTTGRYVRRHGNLRRDGVEPVLDAALAVGPLSEEALYFGGDGPPSAELAARVGDRSGTRVHFDAKSIRELWLDNLA
jgi:MoaA/NifB/PqqE/SkfB family radical SAM enzyme